MRVSSPFSLALLLCLTCSLAEAQSLSYDLAPGLLSFQSYHGGAIDQVNLSNGNLHVHIPLASYPQRGNRLKLDFGLEYNGKPFSVVKDCSGGPPCVYWWETPNELNSSPFPLSDWYLADEQDVKYDQYYDPIPTTGWSSPGEPYYIAQWQTADGGVHPGALVSVANQSGQISLDGSGFFYGHNYSGTCLSNCYTMDSSGTIYHPSATIVREDSNGNSITVNSSGTYTDTVGRAIPLSTSSGSSTGCTGPLHIYSTTQWQVPGANGSTMTFKFCYAQVSINLPAYQSAPAYATTVVKLQSIVLPNQTTWTFEYSSRRPGDPQSINFGDLTKITFPTGGTIVYQYNLEPGALTSTGSMWMQSRAVNSNDGTGTHTWAYSLNPFTSTSGSTVANTVTDPDGNVTKHTFQNLGAVNVPTPVETNTQYYSGSSTLLKSVQTTYRAISGATYFYPGQALNILPTSIVTTLNNGQSTTTNLSYCCNVTSSAVNKIPAVTFSYGRVSDTKIYDYISSGTGPLLRETQTVYQFQNNGSYLTANMMNLVASTTQYGGNGVQVASTSNSFDEGSYLTGSGISTQHSTPLTAVRGNLTSTSRWLNGGTNPVSHTNWYDTGVPYQLLDPMSHSTTYAYSSSYAGSLPTTITDALNHSTNYTYDFNTGQKTAVTDPNQETTTYAYSDSMGRVTDVLYPDVYPGSSTHGETQYTYNDAGSPVNVVIKEVVSPSITVQAQVTVDGFGRKAQTAVQNAESSPYSWDIQDFCYDDRGLTHFVSLTYQGSGPSNPNCSSSAGDTYVYDAIGRPVQVTHSDGTHLATSYTGRATVSTGEGNGSYQVQRISQTDALGNLLYACEVSGTTQQGSSNNAPVACGLDATGTGFLTTYTYDPLGNLTLVQQAGMGNRSFAYDTLSRLTSATNPESGTTQYVYDADGKVINRVRPKANQTSPSVLTTTIYSYDAGHRLLTVSYDDGSTPTENHTYDQTNVWGVNIANPVGRQTNSWVTSNGATLASEFFSYDPVGRVVENDQCGPGNCGSGSWQVVYQYDLLGSVLSAGNGVGMTISYTYNAGDRLNGVTSSWIDSGHPGTLLSGLHYGAFGLTSGSWGNGVGESRSYDGRGRLQSRTDSLGGTTVYGYSLTHAGDGSITYATDTANGTWNYAYDDFGRLSTGSTTSAAYAWDYDRYGNRWHQKLTSGSGFTYTATFSGANNRLDSWSYDAAGNVLRDDQHSYTYDAEGRIASVDGTTSYVYDADGLRVAKKVSGTLTTQYIYDLGSHVVSEVNGSGAWMRGEVYAGDRHIATYANSTIYFTHADWLGTERTRSTTGGSVCESATSLPFGDGQSVGGSCNQSPQFFTGKQRDTESGLDYFKARFFNSTAGRWMLADWSSTPVPVPYATPTLPQTLNLYTYVGNDPVNHVDVDGHLLNLPGTPGGVPPGVPGSHNCTSLTCWSETREEEIMGEVEAQQQTGRQPDGSYIAPTGPGSEIYNRTHGGKNNQVLHPPDDTEGQCVTACKHFSGITAPTTAWKEGAAVSGNGDIPIGTAIATFGSNGKYPTNGDQNSGIYMGPGSKPGSILIYDQWPAYGPPLNTPAHPPSIREMPLNSSYGHSMANSASAYHVIIVP